MATRSLIGVLNTDQTVTGIYCHWDGYPSTKLKELSAHFGTHKLALDLVSLGDISALWTDKGWDSQPKPEGPLTYADRGENCPSKTYGSIQEFINAAEQNYGAQYCYLFKPMANKWEDYWVPELCQTPLEMATDDLYGLLNDHIYDHFAKHYGDWFENHGIGATEAAGLADDAAKRQIRRLTLLINPAELEEVAEHILADHLASDASGDLLTAAQRNSSLV